MTIRYCAVFCIMLCAIGFSSCKKGCTNPTAFNYTRSAKVDDGSCLYCDSSLTLGSSTENFVVDNNSSSPFFSNEVLLMTVNSNFITYNGNGCSLLGHTNTTNTGSNCVSTVYTAQLTNNTSATMTFSGIIQIFESGSPATVNYYASHIVIAPNGTATVNIGSGCSFQFTGFNFQVLSATFSYQ